MKGNGASEIAGPGRLLIPNPQRRTFRNSCGLRDGSLREIGNSMAGPSRYYKTQAETLAEGKP